MNSRQHPTHRYVTLNEREAEERSTFASVLICFVTLYLLAYYFNVDLNGSLFAFIHTIRDQVFRAMPSSLVCGLRSAPGRSPDSIVRRTSNLLHQNGSALLGSKVGSGTPASIVSRGSRVSPFAPKGLGNWDNSCYQNSILQALAALPSWIDYLKTVNHGTDEQEGISTTSVLHALTCELNDTEKHGAYLWTPHKLKSMSTWQQQDAQEYFSKIIDAVDGDMKLEYNAVRAQEITDLGFLSKRAIVATDTRGNGCHHISANRSNLQMALARSQVPTKEPLISPMEGLLAQRVGCVECGYTEGLSSIPFNCMTLPLPRNDDSSIEQCLDGFASLEYIDGVECAKCTLLQAQRRLRWTLNQSKDPQSGTHSETCDDTDTYYVKVRSELSAVDEALSAGDFTESTLRDKCQINRESRKCSQKSRQAALLRAPRCLVMHVNRSIFDEHTGAQLKNYALIDFPRTLDLSPWTVGGAESSSDEDIKRSRWIMDPEQSMFPPLEEFQNTQGIAYELKAVITHFGRHENGHYICYRQSPTTMKRSGDEDYTSTGARKWWRLSDENVVEVSLDSVLSQHGAFMLFYERIGQTPQLASEDSDAVDLVDDLTANLEAHDASIVSPAEEVISLNKPCLAERSDVGSVTNITVPKQPAVSAEANQIPHRDSTDVAFNLDPTTSPPEINRQVNPTSMRTATPTSDEPQGSTQYQTARVVEPL